MKTLLTLLLIFYAGITSLYAQWTDKSGAQFANDLMWNVQVLDANNVWAINYNTYEVVKTTNGGQTWTALPVTDPTYAGFYVGAIHVLNPTTAWLTASTNTPPVQSRIYKTTDGGLTWQHQTSAFANPSDGNWTFTLHFFDANNGVCLSERMVQNPGGPGLYSIIEILTTANGGTTWQEVPGPNMPPPVPHSGVFFRAYAAVGDNMWFMTMNFRVYKTTNKGLTWTETDPGFPSVSQPSASIAFSDANNGIATNGAALKRTTDGGATWTTINPTGTWHSTEIAYVPGTPGTFISGGLAPVSVGSSVSTDHGNTWTTLESTQQHSDIHFINPSTGWSAAVGKMLQFNSSILGVSKEKAVTNSFFIYPNPGTGTFHIKPASDKPFMLEVYDLAGKKIMQQPGNSFGHNTMDLSGEKKGIYLLHILSGEQRIVEKVVLQ